MKMCAVFCPTASWLLGDGVGLLVYPAVNYC